MNDSKLIAEGIKLRIVRLIARKGAQWLQARDRLLKLHSWLVEAERATRG
jgi:hypothetical protein